METGQVMSIHKKSFNSSKIKNKAVVGFLIIIIVWGLIRLCVPILEYILIVDRSLPNADALVVMAGEMPIRLPAAANLYKNEKAGRILLTNDGIFSSWSDEKQRNLYQVEWAEETLLKMQVPANAIVKLPYSSSGSIHDALNTRKYVLDNRLKSIIIVTSDYHSRRSIWIFERVFQGYPVEIGVYSIKNTITSTSALEKCKSLLLEAGKFVYYRFRYIRVPPI